MYKHPDTAERLTLIELMRAYPSAKVYRPNLTVGGWLDQCGVLRELGPHIVPEFMKRWRKACTPRIFCEPAG